MTKKHKRLYYYKGRGKTNYKTMDQFKQMFEKRQQEIEREERRRKNREIKKLITKYEKENQSQNPTTQ